MRIEIYGRVFTLGTASVWGLILPTGTAEANNNLSNESAFELPIERSAGDELENDISGILSDVLDPEGFGLLEEVLELNADDTAGRFIESFDGFEVEIASDPLEDLVMRSEDGVEVRVDLPVTEQSVMSESSGVAYIESENDVVLVPQITRQGDLRVLAVLESESAPSKLEFGFSTGSVSDFTPHEDGGFSILDVEGEEIAVVDPPWAIDAQGRPVPTKFEFEGEQVYQVIDTSHLQADGFPVVADPVVRARHFYYKVIDIRRQRAQANFSQRIGGCIIGPGAGSCSVKKGLAASRTIQTEMGLSNSLVAARLGIESTSQVSVSVSCTSQNYKRNKKNINYNVYAVGDFYTYKIEKWKRYTVGTHTKHTKISTSAAKKAFNPSPNLFKCKVN